MSNTIRPQQPSDHGLDIWRTLNADQQPTWADHPDYAPTVAELEKLPPLVFAGEVDS
ncbi:MAG: 3-deoxy-7-phosphoheptulonate synthase, partial [Rothia dentocariosa]|nr:3-deoxy-7-phosphoheptulonate synthase [Rothia dentocariosa]